MQSPTRRKMECLVAAMNRHPCITVHRSTPQALEFHANLTVPSVHTFAERLQHDVQSGWVLDQEDETFRARNQRLNSEPFWDWLTQTWDTSVPPQYRTKTP